MGAAAAATVLPREAGVRRFCGVLLPGFPIQLLFSPFLCIRLRHVLLSLFFVSFASVRMCVCADGCRLEAELEAATAELRVQTKKAREIEGAKERAEAKAARRNRGLEELMEKNRRVWRSNVESFLSFLRACICCGRLLWFFAANLFSSYTTSTLVIPSVHHKALLYLRSAVYLLLRTNVCAKSV